MAAGPPAIMDAAAPRPLATVGPMSDATIHDAPDLSTVLAKDDPWRRDQRAFAAMLPSLLATHRGQYVAVHDGKVVVSGADKVEVALEAYLRVGYGPLYVGLVTLEPRQPVRMPYFRARAHEELAAE